MRTRPGLMFATLVLTTWTLTPTAWADDPCQPDVVKFCPDVKPGGGRIVKCLKQHDKELSPACTERLAQAQAGFAEAKEACQDDVHRFCAAVKPGEGRIIRCIVEHQAQLTPDCRATVDQAIAVRKEKIKDFKEICGPDIQKYCEKVPAGQGRILACLKGREADLQPECKAALTK